MHKSFTLLSLWCFAFVLLSLTPTNAAAQKKSAAAKKGTTAAAKKSVADKKGKTSAKKADKKSDKKADSKSAAAGRNGKNGKDAKDKNGKKTDKNSVAEKRRKAAELVAKREAEADRREAEAERRRVAKIEAERREAARQAALEAARRREAARQAAIARERQFQNSLRVQTQVNIANDDTSGEDLTVRQAAIRALGSKAGSVVVMDAQNGQVVTVVNQKWAEGQGYKPCSTVKLITGTAGVNEKVITPTGSIAYRPSALGLTDAIAVSNNGYFQAVGGQVGFPKMMQYARELGVGQPTGINAPNEAAGRLPDFKSGYAVNHMSSHGDDIEITPLQLATMVSAITNGGRLLTPQIARTPAEVAALHPKIRRQLNVPNSTLQTLWPGMMGAVAYGTARRANDPSLNIGGKTGSCIGQGSWLGLFASVAPISNPKYAVVVVTRGNAERGKWAAAVAGQIYQTLAPKIRQSAPLLANSAPVVAKPKIDSRTAASLSDEDKDDAETDVADGGDSMKTASPKLVKPTVETRPVKPFAAPNTKTRPRVVPQ